MVEDTRSSREPRSAVVKFASGDSGNAKDGVIVRDGATLSLNEVIVTYSDSGTTPAEYDLYDADEGDSVGSLSDPIHSGVITPGDIHNVNGVSKDDVQNDIICVVDNNDDDVILNIGGMLATG